MYSRHIMETHTTILMNRYLNIHHVNDVTHACYITMHKLIHGPTDVVQLLLQLTPEKFCHMQLVM